MKLQSAVLSLGWQQKRQTWDTKISKAWPEMQKKNLCEQGFDTSRV